MSEVRFHIRFCSSGPVGVAIDGFLSKIDLYCKGCRVLSGDAESGSEDYPDMQTTISVESL